MTDAIEEPTAEINEDHWDALYCHLFPLEIRRLLTKIPYQRQMFETVQGLTVKMGEYKLYVRGTTYRAVPWTMPEIQLENVVTDDPRLQELIASAAQARDMHQLLSECQDWLGEIRHRVETPRKFVAMAPTLFCMLTDEAQKEILATCGSRKLKWKDEPSALPTALAISALRGEHTKG